MITDIQKLALANLKVTVDRDRIAPGVYFYRITVQPTHGGESFSSTRRTVFMR